MNLFQTICTYPLSISRRLKEFVKLALLSIVCLFYCDATSAQYDNLLNKTYAQRAPYLWKIGEAVYFQRDSTTAFAIAGSLIEFGRRNKDMALQLEGELYAAFYLMEYFPEQRERNYAMLTDIIHRAAASNSREVLWKTKQVLAKYYFYTTKSYETAFEEYNELYRLLQPITTDEFPDKVHIIYYIGTAYFYFHDYAKAIKFLGENPGLYPENHFQYFIIHSINNVSACYKKLGMLDSSDYYSKLIYEYAIKKKDSTWIGIVKGNLAYTQYLREEWDQAIPLLNDCVMQALTDKEWSLASGTLMTLGEIYFKQHNITAAKAAIEQASAFIKQHPPFEYERYGNLYDLLAKMYAYEGKWQLSVNYMDSATFVKDSLHRQFSGQMLARVAQKEARTQQKARLAEFENRKKLLTVKFYAFIVIAGLAFIMFFFVFRNRQLKHKQEAVLKDMALKEKDKELEMARVQLHDLAHHLAVRNELIQQLEKQNGSRQAIQELEQAVILTGKDWGRFRELFELVHPGFLRRLAEKIPGISPAETRLMTLAKLNFSNKEMAAALGVTPQSIRVTWHRLRKKKNLQEDGSNEEFINMI